MYCAYQGTKAPEENLQGQVQLERPHQDHENCQKQNSEPQLHTETEESDEEGSH